MVEGGEKKLAQGREGERERKEAAGNRFVAAREGRRPSLAAAVDWKEGLLAGSSLGRGGRQGQGRELLSFFFFLLSSFSLSLSSRPHEMGGSPSSPSLEGGMKKKATQSVSLGWTSSSPSPSLYSTLLPPSLFLFLSLAAKTTFLLSSNAPSLCLSVEGGGRRGALLQFAVGLLLLLYYAVAASATLGRRRRRRRRKKEQRRKRGRFFFE